MPAGNTNIELEQLPPRAATSIGSTTLSDGQLNSEAADLDPLAEEPHPDGGRGWVIAGASAALAAFYTGHNYAWGIIQAHLARESVGPPPTLAFIGALAISLMAFLGLVSTVLVRRYGVRRMAFGGVSFMALGVFTSSFATTSVGGLFMTSGVLIGVGESIMFMATVAIIGQYFLLRRGAAMGIVYAGGAVGGVTLSLSFEQLIQRVGLPWTFRIYTALIICIGYPAAWLLIERPVRQAKSLVDVTLFRDYRFLLLFFGAAIGVFPLFVPPFFLPSYATAIGLSSSQGAGLVAGYNLASLVGRLGFGASSDRFGPLNCLALTLVINAVSFLAIWPVSTTVVPLIFFIVLNGAANGGFFTVMPTVVGSIFGSARLGVGMAMVVWAWTLPYLLGSPIAGYLVEAYGGTEDGLSAFFPAMIYAGGLSTASLVCILTIRFKAKKSLRARL